MEPRYEFSSANFVDRRDTVLKDDNSLTNRAHGYVCKDDRIKGYPTSMERIFSRQTEVRNMMSEKDINKSSEGLEKIPVTHFHDDAYYFFSNDDVTNISSLTETTVRKIYAQRQPTITSQRVKKKQFGSAKTANRKTRSTVAPRRVASGPTSMKYSSSSSDEATGNDTQHLMSAPDPAPSDMVRFTRRKRSPMNRKNNINKNTSNNDGYRHSNPNVTDNLTMSNEELKRRKKPANIDLPLHETLDSIKKYSNDEMINWSESSSVERSISNVRNRSNSTPRPINIPITPEGRHILTKNTSLFAPSNTSPCYSPKSPRSPHSPRSPITRQRKSRITTLTLASPRYAQHSQLSPLPTIYHSPDQSSRASSSNSNQNVRNLSIETLRSPGSPCSTALYDQSAGHDNRLFGNTGNRPISPSGHLALLASRRRSAATHFGPSGNRGRRQSNFLELPVSDYEVRQKRERRYQSLPEEGLSTSTGYNPRQIHSNEIYRLRAFSISPNGALINHGDQIATRTNYKTSTSNNSTANTTRSHSRNTSPQGGPSPRNRSPVTGGLNAPWQEDNVSGDGPLSGARGTYSGFSHSQRSPWSTCGSSSYADGLDDMGDELLNSSSLNKPINDEFHGNAITRDGRDETEKLRVCLLGHIGVGKTSLVNQFLTSDFMHTYDISIDEEFGERSVFVSLDGIQSELILIDHPSGEMSVENMMSTYEPHAVIVAYSIIDRASYHEAEKILNYLWKMSYNETKGIILVANKIDLERSRVISHEEGKLMAQNTKVKFIEASVGIQHNIDELLVGVLKQIRFKREKSVESPNNINDISPSSKRTSRDLRRASSPLRTLQVARDILARVCIATKKCSIDEPCENLLVP